MATVSEALGAKPPLGAALAAGIDSLSGNQTIRFTKYVKMVLPIDGFVFWVKADQLSDNALLNASRLNSFELGAPAGVITRAATIEIKGSFHFSANQQQSPDESYPINRVVFTAESPINDFNEVSPRVIYIGDFGSLRFAFSNQGLFYQQADTWHYSGDAIYPSMQTQIVDDLTTFDSQNVIVSNSLPVWLQLDGLMPVYPAYLVPDNIRPPFAVIDIAEDGTTPIQAIPFIEWNSTHWQLVKDRVRVSLAGVRNFGAQDYVDYVLRWITNNDEIMGLMNMPVVRDARRWQTELGILAQWKTIEFEVSYYQTRVNNLFRQMILRATCPFIPDLLVIPVDLINDGGVLALTRFGPYPTEPNGLYPGALYGDTIVSVPIVCVAGTPSPDPAAPPVFFGAVSAYQLLAVGGANLPLSDPGVLDQLWNNAGMVCISIV